MQLCGLSVRAFDIHGNRTTALHMILHRNYDLDADAKKEQIHRIRSRHTVSDCTHTHTPSVLHSHPGPRWRSDSRLVVGVNPAETVKVSLISYLRSGFIWLLAELL